MLRSGESDVTDGRFLRLYRSAFPPDEQIHPAMLRRLLGHGGKLLLFEDSGEFVGFSFVYSFEGILYIAYIAVVPSKRDLGYGSEILEHILSSERYRSVFLTAEKVSGGDVDRLRRVRFYRSNGWRRTGTVLLTRNGADLEVYQTDSGPSHEEVLRVLDSFYDTAGGLGARGPRSAAGRTP